jgi:HAD superfamily hydrolase (TIGR01509 family)
MFLIGLTPWCAPEITRKSKPEPESFLLAASRLLAAPETCLVFEDSDTGIQAATSAGMTAVKIPPPRERIPANK